MNNSCNKNNVTFDHDSICDDDYFSHNDSTFDDSNPPRIIDNYPNQYPLFQISSVLEPHLLLKIFLNSSQNFFNSRFSFCIVSLLILQTLEQKFEPQLTLMTPRH